MASSMAALSRRLSRALLANPKPSNLNHPSSFAFTTKATGKDDSNSSSELEDSEAFLSDSEPRSSPQESNPTRAYQEPLLENGLDVGVYRAILVGQVGQKPIQKKLKSGMTLTLFSLGTGGLRNNRRPLENESPKEFAERSNVQWHRVCVYPERLGALIMQNVVPGSILYLDGNIETKIFTDPISGMARRLREISLRRNGRVVFLGKVDDMKEPTRPELLGSVA